MAAIPAKIGRYTVREVIGAGGFATVYRATDERLEVDVAVKVLAENHSIDPEVRERFIEEGRRLRRARDPHLVEVYDLGDTDRAQPYLVLTWADRGDLARRVDQARARGYVPTPADARALASALASALGTLHRHRLVHRDIAPRNVLLRSRPAAGRGPADPTLGGEGSRLFGADEDILVADLGVSKDLARASGLTVAAGTSGFAPPEQRTPGGVIDGSADIWSAGALLVWLACGQVPDDDGRWAERVRAAGWPREIVPVLKRGLAAEPTRRQPTIDMWYAEVAAALAPPAPAAPARSGPVGRGRPRAVAAAVVLAVAAGGGIGYSIADRVGSPGRGSEATITIQGPDRVTVGEDVVFTAAVDDAVSWSWVAPNGDMRPGPDGLSFRPSSEGTLTVRVVAADARGRPSEEAHEVRVVAG